MSKIPLSLALVLALCMFAKVHADPSTGPSRYEMLLNLHRQGPIEIASLSNVHADADQPLPFVCYSRKNPDLPVSLVLNYRVFSSAEGETALIYNMSANTDLLGDQDHSSFKVFPSLIPSFNGPILAGTQFGPNRQWLKALNTRSLESDLQIGLSYHTDSKRHLLILFKINQNNEDAESCQLRNDIQEICIEAEPEV